MHVFVHGLNFTGVPTVGNIGTVTLPVRGCIYEVWTTLRERDDPD